MHAWFAAFADTRYAVVAPLIGVQVHLAETACFYCSLSKAEFNYHICRGFDGP